MALAMAGFTINDAFIKSLDDALPVMQTMSVRGAFLLALMALWLKWPRGAKAPSLSLQDLTHVATHSLVLMRAACELLATVFFLLALTRLPFAVIVAVLQAMPLLVTAGAALFLGESVGWRRWMAIAVGLIGVLIILRPGAEQGFPGAALIFMLACVLLSAARDLCTRRLPKSIPSIGVTLISASVITCGGVVGMLFSDTWVPLSLHHLIVLASASVFLFVGMQGIVLAMRTGQVASIVPFRYTSLLWAVSLGWLVFDEVPDRWTLTGAAIVVGMGIYTFARERQLSQRAAH
jgi:drug/metabolite transporter (DMT)-like permease